MKKLLVALALAGAAAGGTAHAAGVAIRMDSFPEDRVRDLVALQNGARLFANYCLSCHSATLMRWNKLGEIGLDDKQIRDFLIFGNQKVGDMMTIAMRPADAKRWFGKTPPDLSVITRARTSFEYSGPDYLYTLLRGYYRDASSPTGWNNVASPNIAMPNILWERQGPREATIERVHHADTGGFARTVSAFDADGRARVTTAQLSGAAEERLDFSFKAPDPQRARQFDNDVADLVAYLVFMTDPSSTTRVRIGVWVLLFLSVLTVFTWWLNRSYWRDIH